MIGSHYQRSGCRCQKFSWTQLHRHSGCPEEEPPEPAAAKTQSCVMNYWEELLFHCSIRLVWTQSQWCGSTQCLAGVANVIGVCRSQGAPPCSQWCLSRWLVSFGIRMTPGCSVSQQNTALERDGQFNVIRVIHVAGLKKLYTEFSLLDFTLLDCTLQNRNLQHTDLVASWHLE